MIHHFLKEFLPLVGRSSSTNFVDNSRSYRRIRMYILSGGMFHWQNVPFWYWSVRRPITIQNRLFNGILPLRDRAKKEVCGRWVLPVYMYHMMPHPIYGGALSVDGRRLSLCPSVPCLTISREWKSVGSWKLAGRKPMTRVTRDPI